MRSKICSYLLDYKLIQGNNKGIMCIIVKHTALKKSLRKPYLLKKQCTEVIPGKEKVIVRKITP